MFTFTIVYCWNCTHVHMYMTWRREEWAEQIGRMDEQTVPYFISSHSFYHTIVALPLPLSSSKIFSFFFLCTYRIFLFTICSFFLLFISWFYPSLLSTPVREFYFSIQNTHNTQCFMFASSATFSSYKCKHMYFELTAFPSTCYTQRILKPIFEYCAMMEYVAHCLSPIVCLMFFSSSFLAPCSRTRTKENFSRIMKRAP